MAVLSATDILTAYLPVVGEHRSIAPATVGLLLSLRAAATIACRLVMTPLLRLLGRRALLTGSCLIAGLLCAAVALPVPVPVLAAVLAVLGFCLGVGQPLSMTTVVRAAPDAARSTALALRLTGNRLGQVAAPAGAGLIAGAVGWRPRSSCSGRADRRGGARPARRGAYAAGARARGPGADRAPAGRVRSARGRAVARATGRRGRQRPVEPSISSLRMSA